MTEPVLKGTWVIRSSTSRFFTVESAVVLAEAEPDSFTLDLIWEKQDPIKLIQRNFRKVDSGTAAGSFDHPRDPNEKLDLVVTFCPVPGPGGTKRLFGLLTSNSRIEGGGTGVWVAEEPPKKKPPRR